MLITGCWYLHYSSYDVKGLQNANDTQPILSKNKFTGSLSHNITHNPHHNITFLKTETMATVSMQIKAWTDITKRHTREQSVHNLNC